MGNNIWGLFGTKKNKSKMHPKLIFPLFLVLALSVTGLEVTRILPEIAQTGEEFTVTLLFDFNGSEEWVGCVFGERYPANWTVTYWSDAYLYEKVQNDSVSYWGVTINPSKEPFFSDFDFTYAIQVPMQVSNLTGEFKGVGTCLNIDGTENVTFNTTGDRLVTVVTTTTTTIICPKGDLDCDGVVDDFDLLAYVDLWVDGQVSDFDLLEAVDNWAMAP